MKRRDQTTPLGLLALCPAYRVTPLHRLRIEGRTVFAKDETGRMGLGSFKALGGIYAVLRLLERETGVRLRSQADLSRLYQASAGIVFVCASAGNHGLAVATGARLFGARARIVLSNSVPEAFADRLRGRGAEVLRRGETYEDSVDAAVNDARQTGAIHLADGSWPGYIDAPSLVMEGYGVIAEELRAAFSSQEVWPTHVYLQAGVGGLAAAMAREIRSDWPFQPRIIVVEPDAAPCLGASVALGRRLIVDGPVSNMGRLDCKAPSLIALDILRDAADEFVTVTDAQATAATETLARHGLMSTPSGSAGLAAVLTRPAVETDRSLIIVSEGLP